MADRLRSVGIESAIETITTRGDSAADRAIPALGGDGVFVREIERALLDGRIDIAVHSCKDLPTADVPGLVIGCVPERANPFDVLVGPDGTAIRSLPAGAIVGTSSVRRMALIRSMRPDLVVRPVRGNVDTRLKQLDDGACDALVLAGAGLHRLGLAARISQVLEPPAFWPAVGQGALAIQIRSDDDPTRAALTEIDHAPTHVAVLAERACLAALAGGCLAPIGGWGRLTGGRLTLGACVLEPHDEGVHRIEAEDGVELPGGIDRLAGKDFEPGSPAASVRAVAAALGRRIADQLHARGASEMLARVRQRAARESGA